MTALAVIALFSAVSRGAWADRLTVFAAASMTDALTEIAKGYEAATGTGIVFSFAASSTLARQIMAGAPADIFVSANVDWMDHLETKGFINPESRIEPVGNSLVLVRSLETGAAFANMPLADALSAAARDGRFIAVGDPDHVPAGLYAKTALESLGLFGTLSGNLARADNVRAALALVESGEAPLGIVYSTDAALARDIAVAGVFPRDSHPPIRYPMARIAATAAPGVDAFLTHLAGPEAARIFEAYGFDVSR